MYQWRGVKYFTSKAEAKDCLDTALKIWYDPILKIFG